MVKGTAFMRDFKTNAHLFGIRTEYFLVRYYDKPGGIGTGLIDPFL